MLIVEAETKTKRVFFSGGPAKLAKVVGVRRPLCVLLIVRHGYTLIQISPDTSGARRSRDRFAFF